jgi:uncharacterized membrane protein YheB (UPF0754 family)
MPLSLLVEIAASALMGCAVGWVTNAVAIDMLFRKYWKWGGVIEDRYAEFIKNMSQLVEDDLINSRTLFQEFASAPFKAALRVWIEDILKKELPENSGTLRLADIPGIEQSADGIIALIDTIQPALLNRLYSALKSEKIGAFVSEEQYKYFIITNTRAVLSEKDHYAGKIQGVLADFLKDKAINTLISDKAVRHIAENIKTIIQKADFSVYDRNFDKAYQELLVSMDIDRIINSLQDSLSKMRLSELVNNAEELFRDLVKRALRFACSPEGRTLMSQMAADFLQDARRIDLKIAHIFSPAIQEGIIRFCKTRMPGIIDQICGFVRENRREIEAIINDTVDKQLESTLGGIIGKLFKAGGNDNLAAAFAVTDKIIDALQRYRDQAGTELSRYLINLLETKTIGEIAAYINVSSLVLFINRSLGELENKDSAFIDALLAGKILDKPVGELFGAANLSIIKTGLLPWIFDRVKQDYLYSGRFKQDMCADITGKAVDLAGKAVSDVFDVSAIPVALDAENIAGRLLGLRDRVSEIKISAVFGDEPKIPHIRRQTFQHIWHTRKNRDLNQLYKAAGNDKIYAQTADWIISILNQNADALLTGNVSSLVTKELGRLEPKEINSMVRDFMGKEMVSINILGAFLGLVIGGLSAAGAFIAGLPRDFIWWMFAAYGALFAAVGIGTNWLAIKMLFRPYKALFPGAKIPPFIGVVPARKSRFAKNIGAFVKVRLLGDNALTAFFTANKDRVKDACSKKAGSGDYAAIDTFFRDDRRLDQISGALCGAVRSYITANRGKTADAAASALKQGIQDGRFADFIPVLRDGIVKRLRESDIARILANFIKHEAEGKSLGAYKDRISRLADLPLRRFIEGIAQDLTRHLTLDKIKERIIQQDSRFLSYIESRSIADVMGNEAFDRFRGETAKQTGPLLHPAVKPLINTLQKEEFAPDKKLNHLFGGVLPRLLEKNSGFIIALASKKLGAMRGAITDNIKDSLPFYAAPWKGHVEPVVNTLIDKELPAFLNRQHIQLEAVIKTLLENSLADLGFDDAPWDIPAGETLEREASACIAGILIKRLCTLPVKTLLGFVNIRNVEDAVQALEPLLSVAAEQVQKNAARDEVIDTAAAAANDIFMGILDRTAAAELLDAIDLEQALQPLAAKLAADNAAAQEVSCMVEDALSAIKQNPAFYDGSILRQDIADCLRSLDAGQGWERLDRAAAPAIKELLYGINRALAAETKHAVCNEYLLTAVLNSAVYNFPRIIRSIDVQAVVEREINNMHPSGIEKLFYKFAGGYFGKITFYGWIGVFGGLLGYAIGCAFALLAGLP